MSSSTLSYFKKPFSKKFGKKKNSKKGKNSEDLPETRFSESTPEIFEQPNLSNLRGELESAVSQYLNQVKELGYYRDPISRDTPCSFTTFKTPSLPKKTSQLSVKEDSHLDVKFQLSESPESTESTEGVDNPLYLSLNECLTGEEEPLYENNTEDSIEDDHIYENVEPGFHLYDTVAQNPRPKLPPKPKVDKSTKEERVSPELPVRSSSIKGREEQQSAVSQFGGSETSDLGSSGGEDVHSEEEWPLPPPVLDEVIANEEPLPPPPPELALEKLEEQVAQAQEVRESNSESKVSDLAKIENNTYDDSSFKFSENTETLSKKHLKKRQSTIKKGLKIYNETVKKKCSDSADSLATDQSAIRHSVIIELKDSNPPNQIQLTPSKLKSSTQSTDSDFLENPNEQPTHSITEDSTNSLDQQPSSFIEISDDGSWEMKCNIENNTNSSSKDNIDPFTGLPIMNEIPGTPPHKQEINQTISPIVDTMNEGLYSASFVDTNSQPESLQYEVINFNGKTESGKTEMSSCNEGDDCSSKNIGAAIMAGYEKDLNKKKETLNLPEISMLEFGDSAKDLEIERRSVIEQMTVKVKKKDSWIRAFRLPVTSNAPKDEVPVLEGPTKKVNDAICHESFNESIDNCKTVRSETQQDDSKVGVVEDTGTAQCESKMLSTDDGGWESVANVQFQTISNKTEENAVPPPPEFTEVPTEVLADISAHVSAEVLTEIPLQTPTEHIPDVQPNEEKTSVVTEPTQPAKQYVYGLDEEPIQKPTPIRVIETVSKKSTHENVIEAEIREQHLREMSLREEAARRARDKTSGASSPSSHASDEGFVDRATEDLSTPPTSVSPTPSTPQIYETTYSDKNLPTNSETKIALEIRELREREAELRAMREIRIKKENIDEFGDDERTSSSSRDSEDPMTSIVTTTDEGNFSEYGDSGSTEDKNSDGFNSRIMSPDPFSEHRQRKITVKPFEDEDVEETPMYTRMKNESVIEREIRLAKEREEAYRREKGLVGTTIQATVKTSEPIDKTSAVSVVEGKRGSQRVSSGFIQRDIEAGLRKERELHSTGQIKTLSEDTVDSKVTRMTDLASELRGKPKKFIPNNKLNFNKGSDSLGHLPAKSFKSPVSPAAIPCFTPSPRPVNNRLTRSFSTNNLSTPFGTAAPLRAPKGLMQKFIASRGKMTGSTFIASSSSNSVPEPISIRPMTVQPKVPSVRVDTTARTKPETNGTPRFYKRTHATAEEKIQSELKEMKRREEELRRLRARSFGRSQPNLTGIGLDEDESLSEDDSSCLLPEINGLKSALSNPNLLDDESDRPSLTVNQTDKAVRRRSALIAQWENRIQQTADT